MNLYTEMSMHQWIIVLKHTLNKLTYNTTCMYTHNTQIYVYKDIGTSQFSQTMT